MIDDVRALLDAYSERAVPAGVMEALRNYDVTAVPWSRREEVSEELAA